MEDSGAALAAAVEATVFLGYFNEMPDYRQAGKVAYPLDEVLLLALMAVLAGAEGFTDIARFGEKKLDLLRRFRPFVSDAYAPPGIQLDVGTQFQGRSSSRRSLGWPPAIASRVALR